MHDCETFNLFSNSFIFFREEHPLNISSTFVSFLTLKFDIFNSCKDEHS